MQSNTEHSSSVIGAEGRLRAAFERLKLGTTEALPKGASVTQNNVAREAGLDPSALRKSRFPALVSEIQRHVYDSLPFVTSSAAVTKETRRKNRSLRDRADAFKRQRDIALSMLVQADAKILGLSAEVRELRARLPNPPIGTLA